MLELGLVALLSLNLYSRVLLPLIFQCQTAVSAVSKSQVLFLQQSVLTVADDTAKCQRAEQKSKVQPRLCTQYLAAFTFLLLAF